MPVPSSIADLSTTAGSNSPAGTEAPSTLDNYQRAHASFIAQLRDRAPASTVDNDIARFDGIAGKIKGGLKYQTSTTDTTAGALMIVGAFGLGGTGSGWGTYDLDTLDGSGFYNVNGPTSTNTPSPGMFGFLTFIDTTANYGYQIFTQAGIPNAARTWSRTKITGTWGDWVEVALTDSPAFIGTPTAPTAAPGTNTTQLATTAFSKAAVDATAIGVGQTWQDVSGSRSASTNYTNTTGKPIMVNITWFETSSGTGSMVCDGVTVANRKNSGSGPDVVNASMIVPNGSVYSATSSNAFKNWAELR